MLYYIIQNSEQKGPLNLDQLIELKPCTEDLVWHEGLLDWQKANTIIELKDYFGVGSTTPPPNPRILPPPLPKSFKEENGDDNSVKSKKKRNSSSHVVLIVVFVFVLALIAIFYFGSMIQDRITHQRNSEFIERSEAQKKQASIDKEKRQQRIAQLQNELNMLEGLASECSIRYEEASKPKLFRLRSEKEKELDAIRTERNGYLERINTIAAELQGYGVEVDVY
ncbi:MAG: DUF4339 domain-containing protein [Bacteroidales bacterium]|nr:DUF4339 domain-containing protein [Candidatus Colimorpha pelethequi]